MTTIKKGLWVTCWAGRLDALCRRGVAGGVCWRELSAIAKEYIVGRRGAANLLARAKLGHGPARVWRSWVHPEKSGVAPVVGRDSGLRMPPMAVLAKISAELI